MRNSVKPYTFTKKSFKKINISPQKANNTFKVVDKSYIEQTMEKIKPDSSAMWFQSRSIKHLIGLRLRQVRESKGISQMDLGFEVGLDQNYISKVETGRVNISVENLYKITYYLDLWINLTPRENKPYKSPKGRKVL